MTDDAWINANDPDANFGFSSTIFVHNYGPKYGLLRFDASEVAGQGVNRATLTLFLEAIRGPGSVDIHAVTESWNEANVTWRSQPAIEMVAAAVVTLDTSDQGSTISIDVTDVVRRWADNTLLDAGFLIVTDTPIRGFFDSKEKPGGMRPSLEVSTTDPTETGEAIVLNLANPDDCVIDQPGHYVLDRDWYATPPGGDVPEPAEFGCGLTISADATLDLRGFLLSGGRFWPKFDPVINVLQGRVRLLTGRVSGLAVAIEGASGARVRIENVVAAGGVRLASKSEIRHSQVSNIGEETAVAIGSDSIVAGSQIRCGQEPCVVGTGDGIQILNNMVAADNYGVIVEGNRGLVNWNSIQMEGGSSTAAVLAVGDSNVIAGNVVSGESGWGIEIDGAENVLDGNIVRGTDGGLVFDDTGNYFGDNRALATVPFRGTDGQIDWGGNVGL